MPLQRAVLSARLLLLLSDRPRITYNPNDLPAAPLDPLREFHHPQQTDNPYYGSLGSSAPEFYGFSTSSYRNDWYQGSEDHMGTSLIQGFAEDAQILLGQCANSNFNGWLIPTKPSALTAPYDFQLAAQDHHLTVGDDYANSLHFPGALDSNPTSMAPTPSSTHGSLQPPAQGPLGCPHGCQGTFGRPGEYRRHIKKHANPTFFCTQHGCNRSFYRRDKLNDHLRQKHGIVQPRRARGGAVIGAPSVASTTGNQA